jgi:hypothetical protein
MSFEATGETGSDQVQTQTSSAVESNLGSSTSTEQPSHLDLTSDSLVRIDGKGNPVKLSDYTKGFQSQATKAAQEAAQLRRELNRLYQAQQDAERQRQMEAQRQQGGNQRPDLAAQLESLPYLEGKQAADVVRQIQQDIQYRDQILLAALKHIKEMQGTVRGLNETHVNQSFDGKLGGWIKDGGYPDTKSVRNFARSLYLSYEPGPELDQEFPDILRSAYYEWVADFDAQRQSKLAQQRQNRFVPGKGGNTGPRQPIQPKVDASAREMADMLFDNLQEFGT